MSRAGNVRWLGAVWALLAGGCTALAGLDREYFVVGDETTGAEGGGGGSAGGGGGEAGAGSDGAAGGGAGGGGDERGRSCRDLLSTCGPLEDEDCCASASIPGGSFNRSNNPEYPATVSPFSLDRFEVTVGRFRAFVEAYPGSRPDGGAGAHPRIDGSGWDPAWDGELPPDQAGLMEALKCHASSIPTWTNTVDDNENKPITCLSWFMAFAFCAWDGGRLPTEAEWNYAASGGDEQRVLPWSDPPDDTTLEASRASYACLGDGVDGCTPTDIRSVGATSPQGDGKWRHADMAGNMWEWVLDWSATYGDMCGDCAQLAPAEQRVYRGGAWDVHTDALRSGERYGDTPETRWYNHGVRCARTP
ncbi:formylglycine-generating enzyme family protein [Sorangium sp. So ce131]|uniref:formylglycine-generating enzyme family protein n=1 Tax=Sorangium sp. So ce131 TaxID=3133282 RepID=UPI003F60AC33